MGTATSRQEESVENKNVTDDKSDDSGKPTDEEQNEYKGDNAEEKEPVVEEEILPTDGIQVRSFLTAPGVS